MLMPLSYVLASDKNSSLAVSDESIMSSLDGVQNIYAENNIINSDDYGGMFIDENGVLNILTTSQNSISYTTNTKSSKKQTIIDGCRYSLSYLKQIKTELEPYMIEYGIFKIAIYQSENRVLISVIKEYLISLERLLDSLNVDSGAVKIETVEESDYYLDNGKIYSGNMVKTNNGFGTLCSNGYDYDTSMYGAITCSHVVSKGVKLYNEAGALVGTCSKSMKEKSIDASFTPFSDFWEPSSDINFNAEQSSDVRLGSDIMIVEGQTVKKYGNVTGITTGKILSTDIAIRTAPTNILLNHIFEYDNESIAGDSGGPVYFETNGVYYLLGMNYAGNDDLRTGYACRISEVISKLHIVPLTSEPIPVELKANGLISSGCNGNEWSIILKNHNNFAIDVVYNSYMCHADDAKFFRNLNDGHQRKVRIPANSEVDVGIKENGTAGYITTGLLYENSSNEKKMMVSYANEIKSTSLNQQVNPVVLSVGQIEVEPKYLCLKIKKMYQTLFWRDWDIVIENKNDFSVKVEYNQRMCFREDAANFTNLTEKTTLTISPNSSIVVRINSNGTADYITTSIDYTLFGKEYKKVTYADKLSNNPYSLSLYYKLLEK